MNGLLDEFARMASRAAEHADWLAQQGVPRSVLFGPHAFVVGVCRAQIDRDYWQPAPEGAPVIVTPVSYETTTCCLDPVDVVAWVPGFPDQWYFRRGEHGLVLGEDHLDRAEFFQEPIQLHRTPLDWIVASGNGVCLLDHSPGVLERLRAVGEIIVADLDHGLEIERWLQLPPKAPAISIINFEKEAV